MVFIFGTIEGYRLVEKAIDRVFNFNTLIEGLTNLNALNPYYNTSMKQIFIDELSFDKWYIDYITTTPSAFKQLIDVLRLLYNGLDVFIICEWNNEIAENMIEALIKFITDNYGIRCNIVKSIDDLSNILSGTFSSSGIQLFDANMETYINMFGTNGLYSDHGSLA